MFPAGSPWDWGELSPEEVCKLFDMTNKDDGPEGLLFKYAAVRRCLELRSLVEAGSGFDILACVRSCGTHGLVMPLWLVHAFNRCFDAVLNGRAINWDDPKAFGAPYKKGTRQHVIQRDRLNRLKVYQLIKVAVDAGRGVEHDLFEEISSALGSNATDVKRLYREAKNQLGLPDPLEVKRRRSTQSAAHHDSCQVAADVGSDAIEPSNRATATTPTSGLSRRKNLKKNATKKRGQ